MALDLLRALTGVPRAVHNASVANQSGFAADTYLAGSACAIPASGVKVTSKYRLRFNVVKTAAGVAAPALVIRVGTLGTTGDAALCTLNFSAQTAAVDEGVFDVEVIFRTVGSGTSATLQAFAQLSHRQASTGLSTVAESIQIATSAGFNSTTAGLIIGASVNGGTSAAWTVSLVSSSLENLA